MTVIVKPDELEAMIESGGVASSMSANSLILKSGRSGPFSWTRSAFASASFMFAVKVRRFRDAPGERPMASSCSHASSTYLRRLASALGAGSVATTSNPRARYCAAQLAPMTPVPTIATRRTGLLNDISALYCGKFGIGNAGEVALGLEQHPLLRPIEPGRVDRPGKIGHEHPIVRHIERDADALHQMCQHNFRELTRLGQGIDRCAADGVAARRIAPIGPVQNSGVEIEFQIDRLRQPVEQQFDIAAIGCGLALRQV